MTVENSTSKENKDKQKEIKHVKTKVIVSIIKPQNIGKMTKFTQKPTIDKFVPICHHCGDHGHTRPQCRKIAYRSYFERTLCACSGV